MARQDASSSLRISREFIARTYQEADIHRALSTYEVSVAETTEAAGRRRAIVETGSDPGHAAARATYTNAGFVSLPAQRYYLAL